MTNNYVIKFHHLYYNQHSPTGNYATSCEFATRYVHVDIAKQMIIDRKLGDEHKVYQVNFVEQEMK